LYEFGAAGSVFGDHPVGGEGCEEEVEAGDVSDAIGGSSGDWGVGEYTLFEVFDSAGFIGRLVRR
jgi:hypothetical protein